jgi:hypothetical protein
MEIIILVIFSIVVLGLSIFLSLTYGIHWSMTKDYCKKEKQQIKWLTFKEFINLFEQSDLCPSAMFAGSLFSKNWQQDKSEFHADLVRFDKQYYLLDPVSYFLAKNYIKNWLKNYCGLPWEHYFL